MGSGIQRGVEAKKDREGDSREAEAGHGHMKRGGKEREKGRVQEGKKEQMSKWIRRRGDKRVEKCFLTHGEPGISKSFSVDKFNLIIDHTFLL